MGSFRQSEKLVMVSVRRGGRAGGYVEPAEDIADVPIDRPLAEAEGVSDLLVRTPVCDQTQHG